MIETTRAKDGFFEHVDYLDFPPPLDHFVLEAAEVRWLSGLGEWGESNRSSFAAIGYVDLVEFREVPVECVEFELQLGP